MRPRGQIRPHDRCHRTRPTGRSHHSGSDYASRARRSVAQRGRHRVEWTPAAAGEARGQGSWRQNGCRSGHREPRVIAYLDASALVKRYIAERGSREAIALMAESAMTAPSIVARDEVAAAFAKAARVHLVTEDRARSAQRSFAEDWPDLIRVPLTEALVERAEVLAWDQGLRGYDAVQLASALTWQESVA